MKISVVGLGPGNEQYLTPMAQTAIQQAGVIIGYQYYIDLIQYLIPENCETIGKQLSQEQERAEIAIEHAQQGKNVAVIGSGDAGIYSMAAIVYEEAARQNLSEDIGLETIPGITALQALAGRLGAALGHDFCTISLSDLMTPWTTIEKRIKGAAEGDFVIGLYNPKSKKRYWQLDRFMEILREYRHPETPIAIGRQLGREEENIALTTLQHFTSEEVDMFSTVVIGNSNSFIYRDFLVTPRGYHSRKPQSGEEIQQASFSYIQQELQKQYHFNPADEWAVTRLVHTTGEFSIAAAFQSSPDAMQQIARHLQKGGSIITDVTMVQAGITRRFLEKYENHVHCFLNDEETNKLAKAEHLTRSQAAMRLAIQQYPDALFVIGNAPTALIEVADQVKLNGIKPAGIIAAPVGFVNVVESKHRVKTLTNVPYVMINDTRGGSNLAAALVNAGLSWED